MQQESICHKATEIFVCPHSAVAYREQRAIVEEKSRVSRIAKAVGKRQHLPSDRNAAVADSYMRGSWHKKAATLCSADCGVSDALIPLSPTIVAISAEGLYDLQVEVRLMLADSVEIAQEQFQL